MSSLFTQLRTNIRKVVITALSEYPTISDNVIFSNSNGGEPSGTYVVVNILGITQQGHHVTSSKLDSESRQATQVCYEVMVQLSFIGNESGDMSHSFNQRINNNYLVFEDLKRNKLGVMRKSNVRRAPQKRETKWVEYHNMDVTFSYIAVTQDTVDYIEKVIYQGHIQGNGYVSWDTTYNASEWGYNVPYTYTSTPSFPEIVLNGTVDIVLKAPEGSNPSINITKE